MNTDNSENSEDTPAADASDRRPIGYWLRAVDALITREFAAALESEGVTRREWMALSVIAGDPDAPGLAERLARKGKHLRSLEERGWIEEQGDGSWALTDEGRTAKERIGEVVSGIRSRVAGAVSPEEFATTMASLESIARELGWDETTARTLGRGFGRRRGRAFHPGFRPGFGHGFGRERGFGPGFDREGAFAHEDGCHGHGQHGRHGEYDAEFGHGHHRPGHRHGHPGEHGGRHRLSDHGHHHGHAGEQAFERGFAAGYAARNTGAA